MTTHKASGLSPATVVIWAGVSAALHVGKIPPAIPLLHAELGKALGKIMARPIDPPRDPSRTGGKTRGRGRPSRDQQKQTARQENGA